MRPDRTQLGFLASWLPRLDLDYMTLLARTDQKRYHGHHYSIAQTPFTLLARPMTCVLVIDDLIVTGTTMRLSLSALSAGGIPAWGFAFLRYR